MAHTRSIAEHSEAVSALLSGVVGRSEWVPLRETLGRRLARDVSSPIPLPPFDNSQMDGYAVRSAELAAASVGQPVELNIGETIAAGTTDGVPLAALTAAPIMTGAAIPPGADAVVPIEVTDPDHFVTNRPATVSFSDPVKPGEFIRPRGDDAPAGGRLLTGGELLHARHLGLL
ncbi:MAG: gephyrin-like molybdotransferase Glp, partial [Pseudonocardiaceae bacterium]